MGKLISIKPVEADDAEELFPLVFQSPITATILWNGPSSIEDFRAGLREREAQVREGINHQFTIIENASRKRIGGIDIRPYEELYRGDMGIWVGIPYQGKGYATEAIAEVVRYGLEKLDMKKIEAKIFVGNVQSRKAFEKNGFKLEGTIRRCTKKRGQWTDEWLLGLLSEEFVH